MNHVHRKSAAVECAATGMFLLGALLFMLSYIQADTWSDAFSHPVRTAEGAAIPGTTVQGIGWLVTMLWACGVTWCIAGGMMYKYLRGRGTVEQNHRERVRHWGLFITALLLLGLLVRLPYMAQSLWYDEIAAFWYYGQHGPGAIAGNMFTPANHVLQSIASWASVMLAGGTLEAWILRLPALVAGLLAAWPLHALARRPLGARGALLAVGIILLAPIAVLEGTEARGYAFMLLFSATASALLLAMIEGERFEYVPLYAIACALGAWSHLVTLVVPAGQFLVILALLATRRDQRTILVASLGAVILAGITSMLLLAPVIPDLLASRESFKVTSALQPALTGIEGRGILLGLGGSWSSLAAIPGLLFVILGLVEASRAREHRIGLLLTGTPIAIALVLVLAMDTWVYARFFTFDLPFVALAMSGGMLLLARWSRPACASLVILTAACWTYDLVSKQLHPRQPIRELVALIEPGQDRVASVGIRDMPIVIGWYLPDARERIVDAGPHVTGHEDVLGATDIRWVVHSYAERVPFEPGERWRKAHELKGWIDDGAGTLTLYERVD